MLKLYSMATLIRYRRNLMEPHIFDQRRAHNMGRAMLAQNMIESRNQRNGNLRNLLENLIYDYEAYLKSERPVIQNLGGGPLWVHSASAPFTIEVLERIRAGEGKNLHRF